MGNRVMTVVIEREDGMFVAQCDPFDICTQGATIDQLLDRLRHQVWADTEHYRGLENVPRLPTAEDVRGILAPGIIGSREMSDPIRDFDRAFAGWKGCVAALAAFVILMLLSELIWPDGLESLVGWKREMPAILLAMIAFSVIGWIVGVLVHKHTK